MGKGNGQSVERHGLPLAVSRLAGFSSILFVPILLSQLNSADVLACLQR